MFCSKWIIVKIYFYLILKNNRINKKKNNIYFFKNDLFVLIRIVSGTNCLKSLELTLSSTN